MRDKALWTPALAAGLAALAASLFALALPGPALAQNLMLYERIGFQGRAFGLDAPLANFDRTGFNDRASSAIVRSGTWQVCTDARFEGRCTTLERGEYPDLGAFGLANNISSARPVTWGAPGQPGIAPPYPNPGQGAPLMLFDDYEQRGTQFAIHGAVDSLDRARFNDRARSMVIYSGRWQLCSDAHFSGNCKVFGPGTYTSIGDLAGKLSSLRPVSGGVGPSPGYPPDWGSRRSAILYSEPDFGGRQFVIEGDSARNLDRSGFNDRARSLRIERGDWIFCSDRDFGGTCRTFGPGDYANLPGDLDRRISSARRASDRYPPPARPNGSR